ncbi:Ig-like domain-containing protein [Saccharospirillum impatiens]|uniref:Ig-like domain-containing protein n=1 Tax=Saccharospirillum impatiens TaxID=169438 RepID=UPI00041040A3|nr:Ig-like domain-containing protein [Saccharospirillum impatiens]
MFASTRRNYLIVLTCLALSAWPGTVSAFGIASLMNAPDPRWGFINNRQFVSGYVYTRGIYKNEQGYPVYVEYNAQGEEVAEIGPLDPNGPYANTRIMAAREYQAYVEQYEADLQQFRDTNPGTDDPERLTLAEYQARIETLTTATDPAEPWTGTEADTNLNPGTLSVLVRPQSLLYTPTSPYLMRQYPIDLTQYQSMAGQTGSLLIDQNGQIVRTSQYRIAPRAVYYENPNATSPEDRFESSPFVSGFIRSQGTVPTLTNPIQALPLSTGLASLGAAATNESGKYSMMITATPCPTFFYQYTEAVSGQVPYRAFNPDISGQYWYHITRTFPFICNGMATYNFQPGTNPPIALDFPIDVNILTGSIRLPGVELAAPGTAPVYDLDTPDAFTQTNADYYDFDLDGTPDTTYCGVQNAEGHFVQEADCQVATVQGVYLSTAPNDPEGEGCSDDFTADLCQPNLLRVIDLERETGDKALVSQLAPEHLKDTDLFIIRQATGQLIAQRQGLKDDEDAYEPAGPDGLADNDLNLVEGELRVDFGMVMRGVQDLSYQYGTFAAMREEGGFSDWQAKGNMAPELYEHRTADQVRAGETLEVWAINRVTGYLGHSEIVVGEDQLSDGLLDTKVPDIELLAPNLKIWAERRYNIEAGLTKDEQRDYLISHEGAGEGDDTFIQIFVEWLDQDGSALPDALTDYGYTGRLAYVSGENTLSDASQAGQARFNVQPGKHSELLRLPSASDNNLHYYVQVNGIPFNDYTDFALGGQNRIGDVSFEGTAENNYRPERFVPIKVPLYNESANTLQYQAYLAERARLAAEEEFDAIENLPKPAPLHDWVYRPEYQYSVFDLVIDEFRRTTQDEQSDTTTDIYQDSTPTLSSLDEAVSVLYDLGYSDLSLLPSLDGKKQLVFNLGENELEVSLSENGTLAFNDLSSLALIEPEDFLTASLYMNSDAGNLLWQYAFEYMVVEPLVTGIVAEPHETLYVSADEPEFDWKARLVGYSSRNPDVKEPVNLRWLISGDGAMDEVVQFNDSNGLFLNRIVMPTTAGSTAKIEIDMMGTDMAPIALPTIEVIPGEPHTISYSTSGSLATETSLTQDFFVTVRDKNGNLVQDGTPVDVFTHSSVELADAELETSDGTMRFSIVGGPFEGPASVTIKSADASREVAVQVNPLNIELDYPQALDVGQTGTVTARVTDHEGNAVANVDVVLKSTFAYVGSSVITTDGQGVAKTSITAPKGVRDGELTAMVGMSSYTKTYYSVTDPDNNLGNLQANALTLVGDQAETGIISYARYDDSVAEIPYRIEGTVTVTGSPGDAVNLSLGDVYAPNRALLAAYMMNDLDQGLVQNQAGQNGLLAQGVRRVNDAMIGQGHSMQWLYNPDVPALMYGDNLESIGGFTGIAWTAELKLDDLLSRSQRLTQDDPTNPDAGDTPAEIINLGQGGQTLTVTPEGAIKLSVRTSTDTAEVVSAPLELEAWHRIAVTTDSNQLTLWVDDNSYESPLPSTIDYQWTQYNDPLLKRDSALPHDLILGKGLIGRINGLKFYNPDSQPLITLNGTGEVASVSFEDSGAQSVLLKSQGLMRPGASELDTQRIAITTGETRQYVSLVSTSLFTDMAGFYATHLAEEAPPIELAFNGQSPTEEQLAELITLSKYSAFDPFGPTYPWSKTAHAAFGLGFLWDAINFLIPLESAAIVFEQLALLATDPEEFDAMEFTIAAVDVLTIFPPAKPLKLVTKPMQVMMRGIARTNPKFSKHFAGMLGRVMSKAKQGDFDTLWNLLPFMVIAVDLYSDEEAREGLELIWSSVSSPDDLLAWVDWLGLPGEAWEGDETPEVDAFAALTSPAFMSVARTAYAAPRVSPRVASTAIKNALIQMGRKLDGQKILNLPRQLATMVEEVKHIDGAALRKYVHSPEMLGSLATVSAKGGVRNIRPFIRGKTNARISPIGTLAITAYIGWEMSCGKLLDAYDDYQDDGGNDGYTPPDLGQGTDETLDDSAYSEMLTTLECDSKGLRGGRNRAQVYILFGKLLGDATNTYLTDEDINKEDSVLSNNFVGGGHGALFHLSQIAKYQALHRAGGPAIKEIEGHRKIWLYKDEVAANGGRIVVDKSDTEFSKRIQNTYERYVDIVLGDGDSESWVELKSYSSKGNSGNERYWPASFINRKADSWNYNTGVKDWQSLHRQFSLDRAAAQVGHARFNDDENEIATVTVSSDFLWLFQKFNVPKNKTKQRTKDSQNVRLGSEGTEHTILDAMSQKPIKNGESQKYEKVYQANMAGYISMSSHIQYAGLKDLLLSLADMGFDAATDAIDLIPEEIIE